MSEGSGGVRAAKNMVGTLAVMLMLVLVLVWLVLLVLLLGSFLLAMLVPVLVVLVR